MTREDPVVCAVDVGSSAVRAALVAPDGTAVASARRERADPGMPYTFDLERLWDDTVTVLSEATNGHTGTVAALGIAGHVGSALLDGRGAALLPAGGWADGRGVAELERRWADGRARGLRTVGRPQAAGGALAALCHLAAEDSGAAARVRHALSPKDALALRLTGTAATDRTSAAYTLAFDVGAGVWATGLVDAAGAPAAAFPPVYAAALPTGEVTGTAARLTGLPEGTPVVAGGPDGTLGAMAAAGTRAGALVDVAGTTDVVNTVVHAAADAGGPGAAPGGASAIRNPYVEDGTFLHGGPTGLTGGAFAHLAGLLGEGSAARAAEQHGAAMRALPPGSGGLSVFPALTGSRFPFWDAAERGGVIGLEIGHTAAHVLRAAQEAAAYVVRASVELLDTAGDAPAPLVLAGGTAKSADAAQLRADVLGREVAACADPDVSLLGAAMVAAVGAGLHPDIAAAQRAMTSVPRTVAPDPERAGRYNGLYRRWCADRAALAGGRAAL